MKDTRVGDTITGVESPAAEALPGYRPAQAMVYCGIYTQDGSKYPLSLIHIFAGIPGVVKHIVSLPSRGAWIEIASSF